MVDEQKLNINGMATGKALHPAIASPQYLDWFRKKRKTWLYHNKAPKATQPLAS